MQHINMRGGINLPWHNWRGAKCVGGNGLALSSDQSLLIKSWPRVWPWGRYLGPDRSRDGPVIKSCMEIPETSGRPRRHSQAPSCRQQNIIKKSL